VDGPTGRAPGMAPGADGLDAVTEAAREVPGSRTDKKNIQKRKLRVCLLLLFFTCPLMGVHPPKNGTVFFSHGMTQKTSNQFVKRKEKENKLPGVSGTLYVYQCSDELFLSFTVCRDINST
jgi:hypothetical protein